MSTSPSGLPRLQDDRSSSIHTLTSLPEGHRPNIAALTSRIPPFPSRRHSLPAPQAPSMTARFADSAFQSFRPAPLTVNPVFSIIPQASQVIVDNLPTHRPEVAPIYQELGSDEARSQIDDVDVCRFLEHWSLSSHLPHAPGSRTKPAISAEAKQARTWLRPTHINAEDVREDDYDIQGLDWKHLGTSRAHARRARARYCEAVHRDNADAIRGKIQAGQVLGRYDDIFKFRRMNTVHRAGIQHFQLRNLMSVTSHNDILYASKSKVYRTDPLGATKVPVMDFTKMDFIPSGASGLTITAIDAAEDLVVAGSYCGEYAVSSLSCERSASPTVGLVTHDRYGIICHVELFNRRGLSRPTSVAFSSNDCHVRVLDCATDKFTHSFLYPHPINCSVTDPNAQLRIVVGDSRTAYLTNADSGETLQQLTHHTANVFAASWSSNGIHVATGAEDGRVLVYDARNWSEPIADIACEAACPRSLRFSPLGGGAPVLLVGEAEDAVSTIDASKGMFDKKQVVDFFGMVAGTAWRPDGRAFWVANGDGKFGGLMEFERTWNDFEENSVVGLGLHARERRRLSTIERKRRSWQISTEADTADVDIPMDSTTRTNDETSSMSKRYEFIERAKRTRITSGRNRPRLEHVML